MQTVFASTLRPQCSDHAALFAACEPGVALCTIVAIDGAFSRRNGSQLAILPDGSLVGSLSDTCLEQQLASDARDAGRAITKRYGRGSEMIDFRLPCGGGLDILIDPAPDRAACRAAAQALSRRQTGSISASRERFSEGARIHSRARHRGIWRRPRTHCACADRHGGGDRGRCDRQGRSGAGPRTGSSAARSLDRDRRPVPRP